MSIKSELTKTASYLRSARKAIIGRGGEISPTAGLKDLPEAIYKIPADASLAFRSDDTVAYRKIVPSGAEKFAQVAKVGGMSYKSANVFKLTGYDDSYGLVRGSSNNRIELGIPAGTYDVFVSVYMDLSLLGNVSRTFKVYDLPDDIECYIWYDWYDEEGDWTSDDRVYSGGRFYPAEVYSQAFVEIYVPEASDEDRFVDLEFMLNEDSNAPYTPYFEGLRDIRVTELVSEGANLIPYPFPYKDPTTTRAGITFTDNGDGTITLNGKNDGTNHSTFRISNRPAQALHLKAGTYIGSTGVEAVIMCLYNGSKYPSLSEGCTLESDDDWQVYIQVTKNNATVFENTVVYPMMNYGMTAAPYKPYRAEAVDAFTIPAEIQAIDGYGIGVEGYPNYIDFERKVFVQNTYRKVFDGKENWNPGSTLASGLMRMGLILPHKSIAVSNGVAAHLICNSYEAVSGSATYNNINGASITGGETLHIYNKNYQTVDAWKAHLKELSENDNPLTVEYALAEPIEVDISAYLKDGIVFLQVEGGGTITAVNEREQAVPSTINYIAKVGG